MRDVKGNNIEYKSRSDVIVEVFRQLFNLRYMKFPLNVAQRENFFGVLDEIDSRRSSAKMPRMPKSEREEIEIAGEIIVDEERNIIPPP